MRPALSWRIGGGSKIGSINTGKARHSGRMISRELYRQEMRVFGYNLKDSEREGRVTDAVSESFATGEMEKRRD